MINHQTNLSIEEKRYEIKQKNEKILTYMRNCSFNEEIFKGIINLLNYI